MASHSTVPAPQPSPTDSRPSSLPKPDSPLPMLTSSSKDAALHAALTYAPAFSTDPVLRYLLTPPSRTQPNLIHSPTLRHRIWHVTTRQAASNGGIITNVSGDWACVGIYFVPGTANASIASVLLSDMLGTLLRVVGGLGARLAWRGAVTLPLVLEGFRARYFRPERLRAHDFYYVAYLATLAERRGAGLGSKWVRWVQAKARAEAKPVWLETSTVGAKAMYERCGFRVVEEATMGVGEVDEEGWSVAHGREGEGHEATGVRLWAMVWWPENVKEERREQLEK